MNGGSNGWSFASCCVLILFSSWHQTEGVAPDRMCSGGLLQASRGSIASPIPSTTMILACQSHVCMPVESTISTAAAQSSTGFACGFLKCLICAPGAWGLNGAMAPYGLARPTSDGTYALNRG